MPRRSDRCPPRIERYSPPPPAQDPATAADAAGFRTVGELRDWHRLWLRCGGCQHAALLDARWLRGRRRADEALARVASRCRCTRCDRLGTTWWRVVAADRNT